MQQIFNCYVSTPGAVHMLKEYKIINKILNAMSKIY